jgi:hypothetical protein
VIKLFKITLFILLFSTAGQAQQLFPLIPDTFDVTNRFALKLDAEAYYNSSGISNRFVGAILKGEYIDSTLKNDISRDLKESNYIGSEFTTTATYYNFHENVFGKPNMGFYVGVANKQYVNARFNKDAFDLVFYGNKMFEGDTANLAISSVNQLNFQELNFGLFNKRTFSSVGISLIKGERFTRLNLDKGDLFTADSGFFLTLDLDGNYEASDTANIGLEAFNGWGMATNLVFNIPIGNAINDLGMFSFRLDNFGFIAWNKNSVSYTKDSSYHYDGFEITSLNDFSGTAFGPDNSIEDTLQVSLSTGPVVHMLPMTISIARIPDFRSKEKVQGIFGVRYRTLSNYKPLFFLGVNFRANDVFKLSTTFSYGGYGGAKLGLRSEFNLKNSAYFSIASNNALGFFLKNSGYGMGLNASLIKVF